MNQNSNTQQLKKEIQLTCPYCLTIYQLLESQQGNNPKCLDNCKVKWNQILQDYHSKELIADLDNQEKENNEHD